MKYGVKVHSVEAEELQWIGSTFGHHLLYGGEGLEVRIKNTSDAGSDTYGIG